MPRHRSAIDRFHDYYEIDEDTGCWVWQKCITATGYPRFCWNGRTGYAHRFSCEFFNGEIPDGYTVDHLCSNPSCVNPEHLEAVTMRVNGLRGNTFQGINSRKTHCPHGHEYTPENILNTKRRSRQCKTCARERQRIKQNWQGKEYKKS